MLIERPIGLDCLLEVFWLVYGPETTPGHQVCAWGDGRGGIDLEEGELLDQANKVGWTICAREPVSAPPPAVPVLRRVDGLSRRESIGPVACGTSGPRSGTFGTREFIHK